MALAYTVVAREAFGDVFARLVDVTFDAAYAGGGYLLDPQSCGFGKNGTILAVIPLGNRGGFIMDFIRATGRLMIRDASGGVGAATPEVANNLAVLNGLVQTCLVLGRGQG